MSEQPAEVAEVKASGVPPAVTEAAPASDVPPADTEATNEDNPAEAAPEKAEDAVKEAPAEPVKEAVEESVKEAVAEVKEAVAEKEAEKEDEPAKAEEDVKPAEPEKVEEKVPDVTEEKPAEPEENPVEPEKVEDIVQENATDAAEKPAESEKVDESVEEKAVDITEKKPAEPENVEEPESVQEKAADATEEKPAEPEKVEEKAADVTEENVEDVTEKKGKNWAEHLVSMTGLGADHLPAELAKEEESFKEEPVEEPVKAAEPSNTDPIEEVTQEKEAVKEENPVEEVVDDSDKEIIDLTVAEAEKVFVSLSKDGEYILEEHMQRAMGAIERYPSKKEISHMIAQCDSNGDGKISKAEFVDYCLHRPKDDYQRIKRAFRMFDRDGDGMLDVKEFRNLLMTEGEPLTEDEFNAVMKKVDHDQDGKVSIDEFLLCMGVKNPEA